jgi:hypothetical protein
MQKRSKKTQKTQTKSQTKTLTKTRDYVAVILAEAMEQAQECQIMLKSNDIPAIIKDHQDKLMDTTGFAVMVPENFADEAQVIIESMDIYDDFSDFALEDEDADVFDGDLYDEKF